MDMDEARKGEDEVNVPHFVISDVIVFVWASVMWTISPLAIWDEWQAIVNAWLTSISIDNTTAYTHMLSTVLLNFRQFFAFYSSSSSTLRVYVVSVSSVASVFLYFVLCHINYVLQSKRLE